MDAQMEGGVDLRRWAGSGSVQGEVARLEVQIRGKRPMDS